MRKYIYGGLVLTLAILFISGSLMLSIARDNARMVKWDNCKVNYKNNIALPFTEQMKACMNK